MDLKSVLGIATRQLDAVLDSSGCRVSLQRPDRDPAGDARGLAAWSTLGSYPALVLPLSQVAYPSEVAGTAPAEGATGTVILKASLIDVRPGDRFVVETTLDARQVGAAYTVLRALDSSVGVARRCDVVQTGGAGAVPG